MESEITEPSLDVESPEIPLQTYVGILDFFMPSNYNELEISNSSLYFRIIKKSIKIPLLGCLSGIIISGVAIPFPFSIPLVLVFGAFILTLIIYRLTLYKNL